MKVEFEITERKEDQHILERWLKVFAQMLLTGWDVTIVDPKIDGENIKLYE